MSWKYRLGGAGTGAVVCPRLLQKRQCRRWLWRRSLSRGRWGSQLDPPVGRPPCRTISVMAITEALVFGYAAIDNPFVHLRTDGPGLRSRSSGHRRWEHARRDGVL